MRRFPIGVGLRRQRWHIGRHGSSSRRMVKGSTRFWGLPPSRIVTAYCRGCGVHLAPNSTSGLCLDCIVRRSRRLLPSERQRLIERNPMWGKAADGQTRCMSRECDTVLSAYNESGLCAVHEREKAGIPEMEARAHINQYGWQVAS